MRINLNPFHGWKKKPVGVFFLTVYVVLFIVFSLGLVAYVSFKTTGNVTMDTILSILSGNIGENILFSGAVILYLVWEYRHRTKKGGR